MTGGLLMARWISRGMYTFGGGWIWAQASGGSNPGFTFDPASILNYGALGIIVFAFFTDRIVTKKALDRVIAERDKAEAARDAVIKEQFDRVIPLLETVQNHLIPMMERISDRLPPESTG